MNNKKMKKLLITSTLSTAFLVSPIVMVSCGFNISKGDINLNDQLEMLGSDSAKIAVFNEWISNTFATLYVKNVLSNGQEMSNEEIKNKSNDILHYLRTLNWHSNSTLEQDQKTKFENLVRNAYDFYIAFKSTVKESSDSAIDPSLYFITKAQEWKLKEYVYVPSKEDEDNDGELTLNGFNPSLNYLPPTNGTNNDASYKNDFKLLFKIRGTGVYSEVMKLLLGEIYFLHSNEEQIMKGTDYRKKTKKTTTKDYVDATSFDINDKDYFLVKYLVTKSPQFKWNYSSENQTNKIFIKEWKEFNNLSLINNKLNDWIAPKTNDLATDKDFSLAKLNNYNGLILDTTSDAMDLSNSIDDIKMYGYEKVGLLDTENNVLHSFENLKSRNLIEQNKTNKKLPIIKLKDGSLDKSTREITLKNDIEMSIENSSTTIFNESDNSLKLEDNDQSWTITKLSFPPSDSSTKKINLTVKYEFKVNNTTHQYWYNFDIQDWKNENGTPSQTTPFEKVYSFNDNSGSTEDAELSKKFPLSISIKNKENKNDISYILRVLPIFKPKAITNGAPSTIVINKTTYMLGKFSLENTPWQNEEEKRKLIYFFILNDSSLFTSIQDYWLFNNFNIRSGNSKTKEIISSLGLNEKTKADRKAAGIE